MMHISWHQPDQRILELSVTSTVTTEASFPSLSEKVPFPLQELPKDLLLYTLPQDNIDSDNPAIIRQASLLASGEDDTYVAVYKVGSWIKANVNYSLNTITEDVSQPASWVMENRYGVCDEITSLFIAMVRSLGIPARYVSGVAYTNWNDINDWGPHAWAEVYFPGYGWVPYDVTYGQYGYVDGSHVVLKDSLDSSESSIIYQWKGSNVNVKTAPLAFSHRLTKKEGTLPPPVAVSVRSLKDTVGFGSYNLIEATVTNNLPFYHVAEMRTSLVEGLVTLTPDQPLVLFPEETRTTYWLVHVSGSLDPHFQYTYPFIVGTEQNVSDETRFKAISTGQVFDKDYFESFLKNARDSAHKTYSTLVDVECQPHKSTYYTYETINVSCVLKNRGNVFLEDLLVCRGDDCKAADLGISQEQSFAFSFVPNSSHEKEAMITVKNEDVAQSTLLYYTVYPAPDLRIINVSYPPLLSFGQPYTLVVDIGHTSLLAGGDVVLSVGGERGEAHTWHLENISQSQRINLVLVADALDEGPNTAHITIRYRDRNGRTYSEERTVLLQMDKLSFFNKMQRFFTRLGRWFSGIF